MYAKYNDVIKDITRLVNLSLRDTDIQVTQEYVKENIDIFYYWWNTSDVYILLDDDEVNNIVTLIRGLKLEDKEK